MSHCAVCGMLGSFLSYDCWLRNTLAYSTVSSPITSSTCSCVMYERRIRIKTGSNNAGIGAGSKELRRELECELTDAAFNLLLRERISGLGSNAAQSQRLHLGQRSGK